MPNDLAKMIDEAARSGGLVTLSLYRTAEGWQGNVKRDSGGTSGWRCEASKSPSAALAGALAGVVSPEVIQNRPRVAKASEKTPDAGDIFG